VGAQAALGGRPEGVEMLFLKGVGYKDYSQAVGVKGSRLPELWCPLPGCGQRLSGHGGYERYVGGRLEWIRRGICTRCQVSHAIVAEDFVAYRDLTLGEMGIIWAASGPTAAARALSQSGEAAVRRMRSVCRRLRERIRGQVEALVSELGEQGQGLARFSGPVGGMLVRLRDKVWSLLGQFFSGLAGLWHHGQPPHLGREAAHKPW